MTKEKPSAKEELRKIKESRKEEEADKGTSVLDKSGAFDRLRVPTARPNTNSPRERKRNQNPKKRGEQL